MAEKKTPFYVRGPKRRTGTITGIVSGTASVSFPTGGATRANVALAVNGAIATASSTHTQGGGQTYRPDKAIDGDLIVTGWNDNTASVYPDRLEINFGVTQSLDECGVIFAQDTYPSGTAPTTSMVSTLYAPYDFIITYFNAGVWSTVPSGNITNNDKVYRRLLFSPTISASRIAIEITRSPYQYSFVAGIEAWSPAPVAMPAVITINSPSPGQVINGTPENADVVFSVNVTPARDFPGTPVRTQLLRDGLIVDEDTTGIGNNKELRDNARAPGTYSYTIRMQYGVSTFTETAPLSIEVRSISGVPGDFDDRATAAGAVFTQRFQDTGLIWFNDGYKQYGALAGAAGTTIEVVPDAGPEPGSGVLRITVPADVTTMNWPAWYTEFFPQDHPNAYNFGASVADNNGVEVFYIQLRLRRNEEMATRVYLNPDGSPGPGMKTIIIGPSHKTGRNPGWTTSCSAVEIATTIPNQAIKHTMFYHACGFSVGLRSHPDDDQNQRPAPYCRYPDYANCQNWTADNWETMQVRVELGGPRALDSNGSMAYAYSKFTWYYADETTPEYKLHEWDSRNPEHASSQSNFWFGRGFKSIFPDGDWGRLWLVPFIYAPNGLQARPVGTPDAVIEMTDIIVAPNKIPPPARFVPTNFNPPWLVQLRTNPANKNIPVAIPGSTPAGYDLRPQWAKDLGVSAPKTWGGEVFNDYCGAAIDPWKFAIYTAAHGGHSSIAQNGIQCFDAAIDDDTKRWRLIRPSTFHYGGSTAAENGVAYFPATAPYDVPIPNGPVSRHTLYHNWVLRNTDGTSEIFMGASSYGTYVGNAPVVTDSAQVAPDGQSATYRAAGTWNSIIDVDPVADLSNSPACADHAGGRVFEYDKHAKFYKTDLVGKTWTHFAVGTGDFDLERVPMVFDKHQDRNRIIVAGTNALGQAVKAFGILNLTTNVYTTAPLIGNGVGIIGTNASSYAIGGMTHVYKAGVVDYFLWAGFGFLLKILPDLVDGKFVVETFGTVEQPLVNGLYNRIEYIPDAGGVLYGPVRYDRPVYFIWTDGDNQ